MTSAAEDGDTYCRPRAPGAFSCIPGRGRRRGHVYAVLKTTFGLQGPSPVSLEPSRSRRSTFPRGRGGSRPARIPPPDTGDISREDREAAHRTNRDGFQVALVLCRLYKFLRTALVPVGATPGAYGIVEISWGPAEGRIKNL